MNSVIKSSKWESDRSKSTVTLSFTFANSGKFYGYHYEYNNEGMLVITVSHKPSSLKDAVIMLDPGHGGIDPGAACAVKITGFNNEKDINLSIATKVKELLEAEGATVIMTRSGDDWKSYTQRNNAVRERDPDMFISIHCDSSSTASATGTSAYYYRAYSQPLAKAVHDSLVNAYKTEIYKDNTEVKIDRGTNFYAFRVARVEECPAILIEYGFVSNINECQALQDSANREILAKATVDGIKNYLSKS
jgi:N-acetylmuramoyl-L-alanine amidase